MGIGNDGSVQNDQALADQTSFSAILRHACMQLKVTTKDIGFFLEPGS